MTPKAIPVFVINLVDRTDRKKHIQNEFRDHDEFDLTIVNPCKHEIAAISLWNTIQYILRDIIDKTNDQVILCEDDHQFTAGYTKEMFFGYISEAVEKGADILLGGVSWFKTAVKISESLFWIDKFSGLQFAVIFKPFYSAILQADFCLGNAADYKISSLTKNKMVIHPFISVQKDFGYSDVTTKNNKEGVVSKLFSDTEEKLTLMKNVYSYYKGGNDFEPKITGYENTVLPTYIIRASECENDSSYILEEFKDKKEFAINIIENNSHGAGSVGLWENIQRIIREAILNDDDVIVICNGDFQFTEYYSQNHLFDNIIKAAYQGTEVLSAGMAKFNHAVPINESLFWVDSIEGTCFFIFYRAFFEKILNEPFSEIDTVDNKISQMTSNKMVVSPFISVKRIFRPVEPVINGDVINSEENYTEAQLILDNIKDIKQIYKNE